MPLTLEELQEVQHLPASFRAALDSGLDTLRYVLCATCRSNLNAWQMMSTLTLQR